MSKILIANWKMNPQTLSEALSLFQATTEAAEKYPNVQVVVCPPFVFVEELAKLLRPANVFLGAQDLFWEPKGAYTGEISTEMLKNFSVSYVLIGHSDRRYTIGETDEVINKKIKAAISSGIVPVLLVGEREGENREDILVKQLSADLAGLTVEEISKILIAYEPVWAISTNPNAKPDTPENTLKAMEYIEDYLSGNFKLETKNFLYGGSVNVKNVDDFFRHPEISGAVVGGASLKKEEFGKMMELVSLIR